MSKISGVDEFEQIYLSMSFTDEAFLRKYSLEELIQIYRMRLASDWDFYPDQWSERQIKEALLGIIPNWDNSEKPVYSTQKVKNKKTSNINFALSENIISLLFSVKNKVNNVALDSELTEAGKCLVEAATYGEAKSQKNKEARNAALAKVIVILINVIEDSYSNR